MYSCNTRLTSTEDCAARLDAAGRGKAGNERIRLGCRPHVMPWPAGTAAGTAVADLHLARVSPARGPLGPCWCGLADAAMRFRGAVPTG